MKKITENLEILTRKNPCDGCPALCCKIQILPCSQPQTLIDVDHIKYSLLYPLTEFIISKTGEFSYIKWGLCSLLSEKNCSCSVYGTPNRPLKCVHLDPNSCWYKRNFFEDTSSDICRLNLERFNIWFEKIIFD